MSLHFANPIALTLLLLLVPVVLWARHSIAGLGRVRGITAIFLRLLIVALAALALAQPQWSFTEDDLSVIYVLDHSLSIPTGEKKASIEYIVKSQNNRKRDDLTGLVIFGRTAAIERRPGTNNVLEMTGAPPANDEEEEVGPQEREIATIQSVISPDRTNMAAALRLAMAAFPPSSRKRIVLISDGNENTGSVAAEAEVARRNGIRIDVKPVYYTYHNEVMVEKVVAPSQVEKGATFDIRTVVSAWRPQTAILRLTQNDRIIGNQTVNLKQGRNVFTVRRTLKNPGYYDFTAVIESAEDTLPSNNKASAFTVVRGEGRVLYVEGDAKHGNYLSAALEESGLDVYLTGLDIMPLTIGQIIPYDTLILSNVSASAIGTDGMRAIELAVKDWGVGLVVIGGEHAFGPGGYQGSPLEKALPVTMDLKQRRVMPAGALVVVLHTCEIAQGNFWAQQIAMAALRVLSGQDEFGILYFDWNGGDKWLFPLQKVTDKNKMAAAISTCTPGDMPSFIPSIQMAHKALKASTAAVKHCVIISDGDPAYPSDAAVQAVAKDKISITTIGISPHGPTDTRRLAHIAAITNGRYYEPSNPNALPQIFIKEASVVRRALILEEPVQPRIALSSEIIKGLSQDELPLLLGYVLTTPRQLAEVPLKTHKKDPLLAHWQYGLGRSVAFTSDAKARWGAHWVSWPKYRRFWSQVVRWSGRSVQNAGVRARAEIRDDRAYIVIDAINKEGRFKNGLQFDGILVTPENVEIPLNIEQTGPGRYEAQFDAPGTGTHYLSLRHKNEKGEQTLHTHGLVVPYSAEFRELNTNERLLKSLAVTTGGRILKPEDNVFARTFAPAPQYQHTWPYLLCLAILLAPLDILVRRVFLDYAAIGKRLAAAARWCFTLFRSGKAARPAHMSALLLAKKASREQMQQRARKFEVKPSDEHEDIDLGPTADARKPKVKAAEAPKLKRDAPSVARDDETYMGRLLRAKRKAREDGDEDTPPPPPST